jgi:septum formation protein
MIILASNSPRRKQLLALTGWDYRVLAAQVDESPRPGEPPVAYVRRLAQEKARAALELLPAAERSQALVIAADTTVVFQGEVLGKPQDAAEAGSMLRRLRDRTHQVYTGLAALRPGDGRLLDEVVLTEVRMRDYSDDEIQAYVHSGDPLDKAGAYAIQHAGFHPVQNLQGCYANVMGLPLCHLVRLLDAFELQPADTLVQACQETLDQPCPVFRQVLAAGQATVG